MKRTVFIKNAAILTVSSLLLRFIGIIFRVWLAAKIGAEGIGVYQLVFSVYMFAATFATSGICTAVTRLVSEELVIGDKRGIRRIIRRCCQLSLLIAALSISALYFGAEFISNTLLHEPRAALSLKILGFSLPFMSICSCLKGYFMARRRAAPSSTSQIIEQIVRIAVILPLVSRYNSFGLEFSCAAVIIGDTIAEAAAAVYIFIRYKIDFKRLSINTPAIRKPYRMLPVISHIALPITSGRYLNSLLRMIENVLVPICLTADGMEFFGMIKGMALPILFFPSTLLGALSLLLLPEISESIVQGRRAVVQELISRIIKLTSLSGILFSAIFLVLGQDLGVLIYGSRDVGFLLCALSPIIPFMYLDAISDGILKGLDQQKFTFLTSVGDSAVRIVLILLLLKSYGIYAFLSIMYLSNFLTGTLNTRRLLRVSGTKLSLAEVFFAPAICGFSLCLFARVLLNLINIPRLLGIILLCGVCVPIYILQLIYFGIIDRDDIGFLHFR